MTIKYDPQKVTDWQTPLEKVYARQSQQLDRYHQQLRERDRQEEAATLDLPEMVSKLASFSKTIGQVVEARKTKRKGDFLTNFDQIDRTAEDDKIQKEHFRLLKDGFSKDNIAIKNNLANASPDLQEALTNADGMEIIWIKEYNAKQQLKFINKEAYYRKIGSEEVERVKNLPLQEQQNEFKNWIREELSPFKLSDGLYSSAISDEINRQVDTYNTTSKARKQLNFSNTENLKYTERLATDLETGDGHDAVNRISHRIQVIAGQNQKYQGKEGGLIRLDETEIQQASIQVANELIDSARLGKISEDQVEKLLNHEGLLNHPAGKTLKKAFFNQATENALVQAANQGAALRWETNKATQKIEQQKTLLDIEENPNNWTQDKLDKEVLKLTNSSYSDPKLLKELKEINLSDQNEVVYQNEFEKLTEIAETGNLEFLKAEVESSTNSTAKKEALKEIAFQEKQRKKLNYSERFLDVKVSEGLNLTLKTDEALNWKGIGVRNDLLAFFRKDFATRIKADPNNPNALGESMQAVEDYWEANGGNEQGGVGKFSPTSNGTYDNFNNYNNLKSEAYTELNTVATESNVKKYTDRVNTAWNKAKYDTITKGKNIIQRVLNTPESILDKEDIIAAYENTTISSEVRIKARELGITPTQLLEWQTKALINGGDNYKEIVDLFDLKNKELPDPEKDLQDMIDDQDLLYLLRRVGIENTTPKQRFRLYQYLENSEASVKEKNIENTLSESSNTQPDIGRYSTRSN
jgi:hypothetical protein